MVSPAGCVVVLFIFLLLTLDFFSFSFITSHVSRCQSNSNTFILLWGTAVCQQRIDSTTQTDALLIRVNDFKMSNVFELKEEIISLNTILGLFCHMIIWEKNSQHFYVPVLLTKTWEAGQTQFLSLLHCHWYSLNILGNAFFLRVRWAHRPHSCLCSKSRARTRMWLA